MPARSDRVARGALQQDPLDLEPRRDVRGQLVLGDVGHQAGEVDDAGRCRAGRRRPACLGGEPVARREAAARRARAPGSRPRPRPRRRVAPAPASVASICTMSTASPQENRSGSRPRRGRRHHVVAAAQQLGDQTGADVAGGAGDEDAHLPSMATPLQPPATSVTTLPLRGHRADKSGRAIRAGHPWRRGTPCRCGSRRAHHLDRLRVLVDQHEPAAQSRRRPRPSCRCRRRSRGTQSPGRDEASTDPPQDPLGLLRRVAGLLLAVRSARSCATRRRSAACRARPSPAPTSPGAM